MAGYKTLWIILAVAATETITGALTQKTALDPDWIPSGNVQIAKDDDEIELVMQLPVCRAAAGVCALTSDCQKQYIHQSSDLCGDQSKVSCCITWTLNERHIVQLTSCAMTGSFCAWDEDCPKENRHANPLLCGEQTDVSCCRTKKLKKRTETVTSFRTTNVGKRTVLSEGSRTASVVQLESCLATGGICQLNEDCSPGDRYFMPELCDNQADVSCCKILPPRITDCSFRGGECVEKSVCQNAPTDSYGECPSHLVCCIWTRIAN